MTDAKRVVSMDFLPPEQEVASSNLAGRTSFSNLPDPLSERPTDHRAFGVQNSFHSGHQLATTRDPNRFEDIKTAASRREHGSRARYVAGCRCLPCRAANSRYSCGRDLARKLGDFRDVVSADAAISHIHNLSKLGVGYKAVADAAGVARSIVADILHGRRARIRKNTESNILSVDSEARSGGSLVPAKKTWKLIGELLRRGYSKRQLAKWLGHKSPALQLRKDRITWRSAVSVEKLYRGIEAGRYKR